MSELLHSDTSVWLGFLQSNSRLQDKCPKRTGCKPYGFPWLAPEFRHFTSAAFYLYKLVTKMAKRREQKPPTLRRGVAKGFQGHCKVLTIQWLLVATLSRKTLNLRLSQR